MFRKGFCFSSGNHPHAAGENGSLIRGMPSKKKKTILSDARGKTILDSMLPAVRCGTLFSSDGKRFEKGEDILIPNELNGKRVWQWPEPTLAVLSDGFAMLLRINGAGVLYRSDSKDGLHWSKPCPTDIPNPNNKPKLLNLKRRSRGAD